MGLGSDHTIGTTPSTALRVLPQTSHTEMMMGPKARSSGLRWLLDFWNCHTHIARLFLLPALWNVKPNDLGFAARISPSELRESHLTQIYLKSCLVMWILLHFPKSRIPTSHVLTFSQILFSVFCSHVSPGICPTPVWECHWNGIPPEGEGPCGFPTSFCLHPPYGIGFCPFVFSPLLVKSCS